MLRSIKQMLGNTLEATDGEIGSVKDFYFDDQSWTVRYVVAETGTWLTSRQVLLSPHAFSGFRPFAKAMPVGLTRKQIEGSPSIEWHKPVSRQFEEEYHRYYGWPCYWVGDGMRNFPILEQPAAKSPDTAGTAITKKHQGDDARLRSTQAVRGYHLQANDGITGYICDFMMDEDNWVIAELVVKTGHRFSGSEVLVPVSRVSRISYEESTVFVTMTMEDIKCCPAQQPALDGALT